MPVTNLSVGDILLTPNGEEVIVRFDHPTDMVWTDQGPWRDDEIEPLDQPDPRNPTALEQWLRVAAKVMPSLGIVTTSSRCESRCGCRYCHRNKSFDRHNVLVSSNHFRDAGACKCADATNGGPSCC